MSFNNFDNYQNRKSVIIKNNVKLIDATGILDEDATAYCTTTGLIDLPLSHITDNPLNTSQQQPGSSSSKKSTLYSNFIRSSDDQTNSTSSPTNAETNFTSTLYNSNNIINNNEETKYKRKTDVDDNDTITEDLKKKKIDEPSVVATHYNNIEEAGLAERRKSRILYLRNFNNWIKSMFINEYLQKIKDSSKYGAPIRILDMCCGKGGDLLKWERANVSHVICTDIANVSVEQCEVRYNTLCEQHLNGRNSYGKMFTCEFITCDSTLDRLRQKFKDPSVELNLVSCQFAFHYCFESLNQVECMLRNAGECLRTGDYFIGTIPDAYEIMKRQRNTCSNEFGNDIYKIQLLFDAGNAPLFGAKYNFRLEGVVDCPEYLVYFPLLVKLAKKFGLEFVMKERFDTYYKRALTSENGII